MSPDPALKKLTNVLGAAQASEVISDTLRRIGRTALVTPDDRYRFAIELMKRGGLLEHVGRSMKIQAILMGAEER